MPDLQSLLDRAAIQDVHLSYFHGVDSGNPDEVRGCFADTVRAEYDGRSALRRDSTPIEGIEAVMNSLQTFKRQQAGEWKVTTHFLGNVFFKSLEGDHAETEICAIAFIVLPGAPDKIAMRSLRYIDRLERISGRWLIVERRHTLDWSTELSANFAVGMMDRISTLGRT